MSEVLIMKAYIKPEIEIRVFETEDIVTTSNTGGASPEYKILKTSVHCSRVSNHTNRKELRKYANESQKHLKRLSLLTTTRTVLNRR